MRLTLVAAALTVLTLTACGKPSQALPEQEKANFSKITGQASPTSGAPATPPASGNAAGGSSDKTEGSK
ncbi:MAG TPA: hypothetical protein VFI43_02590 [Nitrosospira sp.]|nr:hypothetical protein [Nitrosospira sp.]